MYICLRLLNTVSQKKGSSLGDQFQIFQIFCYGAMGRGGLTTLRPKKVRPEGGQTIPLHHSIAKYLKNLKLMSRTGTFILGHCVNYLKTKASIHYYFFGFGGYLSTTTKKLVSNYTI